MILVTKISANVIIGATGAIASFDFQIIMKAS